MTQAEPTFEELENTSGPTLVVFGAEWCPICQAFYPQLSKLLEQFPQVKYVHVEDGKGRTLGRQFKVKLWPNLVFLKDGKQVAQMARPNINDVEEELDRLV